MNRYTVSRDRFDLEQCVCSGQVFRWRAVSETEWIGLDGHNRYRVLIEPDMYVVESKATEAAFCDLFRLDEDLDDIQRTVLEVAPELEPYVDALPGLRLMKPSDPVESVIGFACTPNNNLPRILAMVDVLGSHGENGRFPDLDIVANMGEAELRSRGFGYRGGTIPRVAQQVIARGGRDWLLHLRTLHYEEAHKSLVEINGIGPKLADCMALYALHHTEAVPVDTHMWQAATRLYFPEWKGKAVTANRYRAVGELFRGKFGKLAGWAQQYLFYDNLTSTRRGRESPQQRR